MPTVKSLGRPAELLLVEDNYGDALLVREAFRSAKVRNNLTVVGDCREALSLLRREGPHVRKPKPDLILLDLNLPRSGSCEVLEAVRADPELQLIPVIVMTSSKADIDGFKSHQLGANGYIVKPVDFERLREVVASLEQLWLTVVVLAQPQSAFERANAA
jgi:two-component system, chemotaxis family, response regulator Rcp1